MEFDTLNRILDLARWAPSGDNTQPWRFEILDGQTVRIHGHDTRDHILYDYDGHASHIAHGALLETFRIAATGFALTCQVSVSADDAQRHPIYEIRLAPDSSLHADPLLPFIEGRAVQRRPMRTTPLSADQRRSISESAGPGYRVQLFESLSERTRIARMLWRSARIRLVCPEAYPVHRDIIEWGVQFSKDRIPEQAVGVDPMTARLMRWVMQSWTRVQFFNRYLMGTVAPRIQLDYLPGVFCAAHVLIRPDEPPRALQDWLCLGAAWQRLWLTAATHGLHFQPQMTPVIFRWYARAGRHFSSDRRLLDDAAAVADQFETIAGAGSDAPFGVFGRVGFGPAPRSRSLRHDLRSLMLPPESTGP